MASINILNYFIDKYNYNSTEPIKITPNEYKNLLKDCIIKKDSSKKEICLDYMSKLNGFIGENCIRFKYIYIQIINDFLQLLFSNKSEKLLENYNKYKEYVFELNSILRSHKRSKSNFCCDCLNCRSFDFKQTLLNMEDCEFIKFFTKNKTIKFPTSIHQYDDLYNYDIVNKDKLIEFLNDKITNCKNSIIVNIKLKQNKYFFIKNIFVWF